MFTLEGLEIGFWLFLGVSAAGWLVSKLNTVAGWILIAFFVFIWIPAGNLYNRFKVWPQTIAVEQNHPALDRFMNSYYGTVGTAPHGRYWIGVSFNTTYEKQRDANYAICSFKGPIYLSRHNRLEPNYSPPDDGQYVGTRRIILVLHAAIAAQPDDLYSSYIDAAEHNTFAFWDAPDPVRTDVAYITTRESSDYFVSYNDRPEWCKIGATKEAALKAAGMPNGIVNPVSWIGMHSIPASSLVRENVGSYHW